MVENVRQSPQNAGLIEITIKKTIFNNEMLSFYLVPFESWSAFQTS